VVVVVRPRNEPRAGEGGRGGDERGANEARSKRLLYIVLCGMARSVSRELVGNGLNGVVVMRYAAVLSLRSSRMTHPLKRLIWLKRATSLSQSCLFRRG